MYLSVIFAPTCIPIASKRSLSPSSSSSTVVVALEARLVVESLYSLRIAGVGSGAGSRPASIISCSTLQARARACADDARRVLTISIKNKSNAAPSIDRTGASAMAVTRGEEREPVRVGVVICVTSREDARSRLDQIPRLESKRPLPATQPQPRRRQRGQRRIKQVYVNDWKVGISPKNSPSIHSYQACNPRNPNTTPFTNQRINESTAIPPPHPQTLSQNLIRDSLPQCPPSRRSCLPSCSTSTTVIGRRTHYLALDSPWRRCQAHVNMSSLLSLVPRSSPSYMTRSGAPTPATLCRI